MFGSNLKDKRQENLFCDGKMKLKMNGNHATNSFSFKKVFHMLNILKYLMCVIYSTKFASGLGTVYLQK